MSTINSNLFYFHTTQNKREIHKILKAQFNVPQGTLIIEEKPYFTIFNPDTDAKSFETTDELGQKLAQEVERLSQQQQEAFRSLGIFSDYPQYPLSRIQKTNSLVCRGEKKDSQPYVSNL